MSHIVESPFRAADLDALALAAIDCGGKLVRDVQTYRWYGTWVGDSPMPKGMTKADLGKCDHVIRFPGVEYEVGVRQQSDGTYSLVYDWWHSGGLKNKLGTEAHPLRQAYGKHKVTKELSRLGQRFSSSKLDNGAIKVQVHGGGSW